MKKIKIFVFLIFILSAFYVKSQTVSSANWDKLIKSLVENDWKNATTLSEKYLKKYDQDDKSRECARLRYMYIYSVAGLVGDRKIDREDALKLVKKFEGKKIEMPGHTVNDNETCIFNCFWYAGENDSIDKMKLHSAASNKNGTFIHSFEYFTLSDPIELKGLTKQMLTVGGILDKIELQGVTLSAFRIDVKDCYYEY